MTAEPIPHVRHAITVPVDQSSAFELFTERMGDWWPQEHWIGVSPKVGISLERRVGGAVCEIGTDGSECLTGRVLEWEPPRRVVISWQISAHWTPEPDPARASEYEVLVTQTAAGSASVEVTHRHFERHGADAGRSISAAVGGPQGWPYVLDNFATFATS